MSFGAHAGRCGADREADLVPMINSIEQMIAHAEALPGHPYGIQLDSGMNRLGMEPAEWAALRQMDMALPPSLIMSHLACADEREHVMNRQQLKAFHEMTAGTGVPLSFANTGGILMGAEYHFNLTRPGIGTYGGLPYVDARPVVQLDIPVIQCRTVLAGETVGYGNSYTAPSDRRVATISAGYADGIIRAMGPRTQLFAGEVKCPIVGRISMDLIGVDVTAAGHDPEMLELLGLHQSVDTLADNAGTIGYEILTSLGSRYDRCYAGAAVSDTRRPLGVNA
jgi:alanine racemase